jgi:hypothetical protein
MAESQYMVSKSDDGKTYVAEILGGDFEDRVVMTGFQTEQEALAWVATERRKAGQDPRWPELSDDE